MVRKLIVITAVLSLFSSGALAQYIHFPEDNKDAATVKTAVQIKDKGIYNLVVTVQFLRKIEYGSSSLKSDDYNKMVERLLVESRELIMNKILERNELALSDFHELESGIKSAIGKRADELIMQLFPNKKIKVVFSISEFYLLEPTVR